MHVLCNACAAAARRPRGRQPAYDPPHGRRPAHFSRAAAAGPRLRGCQILPRPARRRGRRRGHRRRRARLCCGRIEAAGRGRLNLVCWNAQTGLEAVLGPGFALQRLRTRECVEEVWFSRCALTLGSSTAQGPKADKLYLASETQHWPTRNRRLTISLILHRRFRMLTSARCSEAIKVFKRARCCTPAQAARHKT